MGQELGAASDPPDPSGGLRDRITAVLSLAAEHQCGVPLTELADLLPPGGTMPFDELERWLRARPQLAVIADGWAAAPGTHPSRPAETHARWLRYNEVAQELVHGPLAPLLDDIAFLGVSGSAAYGGPGPDDDLDLVLFTPPDRLWWVLVRMHVRLRRWRRATRGGAPPVCLNYGRTTSAAEREFRTAHDVLFAREALTVRPLHGGREYAALLRRSAWMREELPRLYERRVREEASATPLRSRARGGAAVRAANALAFVASALYLHLVGLVRNHRLRREGRPGAGFRTETHWGRFSVSSVKFERTRARYVAASDPKAGSAARARDLAAPTDPSRP